MHRVEFIGPLEPIEPYVPPTELDPAEIVTDPDEILGMIRRAVTISWKDEAFTYDELANRLAKNSVMLPDSATEREAFFDTAVNDIWQRQKEIARVALQPQPVRMRQVHPETGVVYHGIVTPGRQTEPVSGPEPILAAEEQVTEAAETVTVLSERRPALTAVEIAKVLFEKCTATAVYDTVIDLKKFTDSLLTGWPTTDPAVIQAAIREVYDNGYITWRNTGTKKHPRLSMVMTQDIKQEVLSHQAEGGFEETLADLFAEPTATRSGAEAAV